MANVEIKNSVSHCMVFTINAIIEDVITKPEDFAPEDCNAVLRYISYCITGSTKNVKEEFKVRR